MPMIVHLVDGTYELFRHFYGLRRFTKGSDRPLGAVVGVLQSVLEMIEQGATHIGVATDHVIESFRNDLWPGYKTGAGIEPALAAQFHPLEEALVAMGVVDVADGRARGRRCARLRGAPRRRREGGGEGLHLDAGQGPRAVRSRRPRGADRPARQGDPRRRRRAREVRRRAGADSRLARAGRRCRRRLSRASPASARSARRGCSNRHGPIEAFPPALLGEQQALALLFKRLATLRTDAKLFRSVETLRWRGPTAAFAAWTERAAAPRLLERSRAAAEEHAP